MDELGDDLIYVQVLNWVVSVEFKMNVMLIL